MKKAYFAGGCFWCMTPLFREISGVSRVICGYSGGTEVNPDYLQVKSQKTGHRETVCVEYEGNLYDQLLDLFLSSIDPFDQEGQFIDRGHSYTAAIYWQTEEEYRSALKKLDELSALNGRETAVSLEPFRFFCPAEEVHQNYDLKHPEEFREELIQSGRLQPEKTM